MTDTDATPFQLLLELAARARRGHEGMALGQRLQPHWTGVGFSVLEERLVAPLGEVTEILMPPTLTRLPRVQPWVRGVANVRGRLLPVIGLAAYLGGRASASWRTQRVLVVEAEPFYCGLIVDEVFGLKHFTTEARRTDAAGAPEGLERYLDGAYAAPEGDWRVFRPRRLIEDPRFLDAAA